MWKNKIVEVLKNDFKERKLANPRYSLRAYAKKIGLSIGTLSYLLNGKSSITVERAREILNRLQLPTRLKNEILVLMNIEPVFDKKELSADLYSLIAPWQNRALLFSFDLDEKSRNLDITAKKIGLSTPKVKAMINLFLSKGLLHKGPNGEIYRNREILKTTDGKPSRGLRELHRSNIELGLHAIDKVPIKERDLSSLSFAGNPEKLDELRLEIHKFYEKALAIMESGPRTEVFQLSIQLLPLGSAGEKK